jgi:D5 N terminal like
MSDTPNDSKPSPRKPMSREELDAEMAKLGVDSFAKKRKKKDGNGRGIPPPTDSTVIASPIFSEDHLALLFAKDHEKDARYVAKWGKWFLWNHIYWREDRVLRARNASREICRKVALTLEKHDQQKKMASKSTITAVEELAKASPTLGVEIDAWDRNSRLINNPDKPTKPEDKEGS